MDSNTLSRRQFVTALAAAAFVRPRFALIDDVSIVQFASDGKREGVTRVPKVVKSEGEWRSQLTPIAFQITRRRGTERPFSGAYWDLHEKGIFRCVCCDTAL